MCSTRIRYRCKLGSWCGQEVGMEAAGGKAARPR
jgi:hypothetical protein